MICNYLHRWYKLWTKLYSHNVKCQPLGHCSRFREQYGVHGNDTSSAITTINDSRGGMTGLIRGRAVRRWSVCGLKPQHCRCWRTNHSLHAAWQMHLHPWWTTIVQLFPEFTQLAIYRLVSCTQASDLATWIQRFSPVLGHAASRIVSSIWRLACVYPVAMAMFHATLRTVCSTRFKSIYLYLFFHKH